MSAWTTSAKYGSSSSHRLGDLPSPTGVGVRVVLAYGVIAAAWIVLSDALLLRVAADRRHLVLLEVGKGLLFILVSGLLLFLFVRHELRRRSETHSDLGRTRALWLRVFENHQDAILLVDLERRSLLAANAATERLTGYQFEALAGKPIRILLADPFYEVYPRLVGALETEGRFSGELRIRRQDDVARRVDSLFLRIEAQREPSLCMAILRDVTDRRISEKALSQREAQLSAILETHADGVLYLDEEDRIGIANAAAASILGVEPGGLVGATFDGSNLRDADGEPLSPLELPHHRARSESRTVSGTELGMVRADGEIIPISVSAAPASTPDPSDRGVVLTLRDITAQKTAERTIEKSREELLQAQKLESIGRLAGGIAHDFNNSLTAIFGYGELLEERIPDTAAELREMRRAAEHAAALTRQLLAFSRKQVLRPQVFNVNSVVTETEKMIGRLIGEDIAFATELEPDLASIRADPVQIQQVLVNLAINARDAMLDGGTLTVSTRTVQVNETTPGVSKALPFGSYVELSVSDTGSGIDAADLELIFEPFFTTKGQEGTGLGLSTVYGIVKQSGGDVVVESALGKGATFHVYLPIVAAGEATREIPPPRVHPQGAPRFGVILVVEDDDRIRKLSRRILEQRGYVVESAADASEALTLASRLDGKLDLLVTDVVLPGMNGRLLAETLQKERPHLRVVFMSGYADDVLARRGILDSDTKLLEKPFNREQLYRCVEEALAG